jgi:hypothetical protein
LQKRRQTCACALRHDKLGVSINVAFMTPHVKYSKLRQRRVALAIRAHVCQAGQVEYLAANIECKDKDAPA